MFQEAGCSPWLCGGQARPGSPGPLSSPAPVHWGQNPSATEGKGQSRKTRDWVYTLVSKRLFTELLLLDEVFTNQFFYVCIPGGSRSHPNPPGGQSGALSSGAKYSPFVFAWQVGRGDFVFLHGESRWQSKPTRCDSGFLLERLRCRVHLRTHVHTHNSPDTNVTTTHHTWACTHIQLASGESKSEVGGVDSPSLRWPPGTAFRSPAAPWRTMPETPIRRLPSCT